MRRFISGLAILIAAAAGCGGSDGPDLHSAGGTVTLQGGPLANASVTSIPVNSDGTTAGPVASAVTDQNGAFQLSTGGEPGAVAGTHKVTVMLYQDDAQTAAPSYPPKSAEEAKRMQEMMQEQMFPGRSGKFEEKGKSLVPEKYTSMKTTPLQFEVKPGGENHFKVELAN